MTAEFRYRRLLALYPRDFRGEYEEEMIGVLMSDDRGGPAQVLDLVRGALAARFRQASAPIALRRAARVVQLFGSLLLLAMALRRVAWLVASPEYLYRLEALDGLRVVCWSLVLFAALRGWRLIGLAGAAAGLAAEIAAPARWYLDTPAMLLSAYWIIMAAVVVLVAGLVAVREGGGVNGLVPILAAATIVVALGVQGTLGAINVSRSLWLESQSGLALHHPVEALALLAAGALMLLALARQEAPIRRWLVAWAAPVLITVPLVRTGFAGFIEYNSYHPESTRLIGPFQWAALVLVPTAAFLAVALVSSRFERDKSDGVPA